MTTDKARTTLYIEKEEYKTIKKYLIDNDYKSLNAYVMQLIRKDMKENAK